MADAAGARFGVAVLANDGSDPVTIYRTNLRAIEDALESLGLVWRGQGTVAARPAAGIQGGVYKPTDVGYEGILHYDDGATWREIGTAPPTDPAAGTGGLRTLGGGATQAAAGNHSHAVDAVAGTGSFRTLGTGATQAAAGSHTHTLPTYAACKTADTTRSSTTTLADDPHLTVTIPAGTYALTMALIASTANSASNNYVKGRLNVTGAGSVTYQAVTAGSDGASSTRSTTVIGTSDANFLSVPLTGNEFLRLWHGVFTVSDTVTLALQWAQPNSSSNALTLYGGSLLQVVKV